MNIGQISAYGSSPVPVVATSGETVAASVDAPPSAQPGAPVQSLQPASSIPASNNGDVSPTALKQSIDTINNYLNSFANNSIEFSVDPNSQRVVVRVVDTQTNTVIMQTPSKAALAIAQALDKTQGLLIQTKA